MPASPIYRPGERIDVSLADNEIFLSTSVKAGGYYTICLHLAGNDYRL